MKISHKSKRSTSPHPQIAALIADILATTTDDLPEFLSQIEGWRWPRSDLNSWIKVLNKFDTILEDIIRDHDIDRLQLNAFTPRTKNTVCEILKFERLLLENSTNRKMFNSYDRLNSLLFCSDLDVVIAALFLLLRPSQQYSSQPALSHSLHISSSRLQSLAKHWPNLREHGIDMLELADANEQQRVDSLSADASEVNYTFYRKAELKATDKTQPSDADVFESTAGSSKPLVNRTEAGPVNIRLGPLVASSREIMDVLADAIESYSVPDDEKFELLCRIRAAKALEKGREEDRTKLVVIRLLAIAVYVHTHTEAHAHSSLFIYEPELVAHVAELLQLDRALPYIIQTAAIAALDSLARYRNKIQEVLTAVNAGVNHGLLMSLLRKTVTDIAVPSSSLPHLFVDALLSFVIYISSHAAGGNMVVGAGLIPLLIQIIDNKLPNRLPVVSKTMQLIDNLLYGFTNAFHIFCNSHGVEALVTRIEAEVTKGVEAHGQDEASFTSCNTYGLLPFTHTGVLKHALRSIHRMMQSSGTTEGLRGLIDSSLLTSVKTIIQYRGLFGPTVLPIAINVMATFVHNEPTSLATVQEAGLPEAFYKAVETGLEASIEVIQSIPNAIGALCLSQSGQDQLTTRPSIIPALLSILTSETHLKVLQDKENAALIGSSIDELIRHHPWLKTFVFDSLKSTISKLVDLGSEYVPLPESKHWYALATVAKTSKDGDVVMEDVNPVSDRTAGAPAATTPGLVSSDDVSGLSDDAPKSEVNMIVSFIDVLGRFLEGLFQNAPHCKDFIVNAGGLARLANLLALPCLPYDFANSLHSDSLVQVIRTMTEVCPVETLTYLAKQVRSSLDETKEFWETLNPDSRLLPMVSLEDDAELVQANYSFRRLVTLYIRLTFLSDVYSTAGYAHGRSAISFLPILTAAGSPDIVAELGALHRVFIWENIVFKTSLVDKGMNIAGSISNTPDEGTSDPMSMLNVDAENLGIVTEEAPNANAEKGESGASQNVEESNAKSLKHIVGQVANSLTPFFQAVTRMFMYGRRNPDSSQKKQAAATSLAVAEVLLNHLTQRPTGTGLMPYGYSTVMLGIITVLLFDERSSQHGVHAMLLVDFRRIGGLDAILDVCRHHTEAIARITALPSEERSKADNEESIVAYGGLRVALNLIHSLVSYKPPSDGQNVLFSFLSRDKPETDPDYYEPHDFLVKLRMAALPFLKDLWQAPWLVSAPPSIGRYVIQSVLEIIAGENEEPRGDYGAEVVTGSGQGLLRPSNPDEDRVQQLVDMGFARSAARRALTRSHNNISVATELLLANPRSFVPHHDDTDGQENAEEQGDIATDAPADNDEEANNEHADETGEAGAAQAAAVQQEGTAEDRRKELVAGRESLKSELGRGALRLVDAHPALIFDARQAFIGHPNGHQVQAVRCIIEDIRAFSPSACDIHEDPMAVRFHLLALVLAESPSLVSQVLEKNEQSLMETLLALLLSNPVAMDKDQPAIPKWLASHLLVAEFLLVLGEEPRAVALPMADEEVQPKELYNGPLYREARSILFDLCLRLLGVPSLGRDELLAMFRLLVQLTRDHAYALQFIKCDGLMLLTKHLNEPQDEGAAAGSQPYVAIILRHLMEDKPTLERLMEQDIRRLFAHPRTRVTDVSNYVRNCAALASRDPQTFVKVTTSLAYLVQPDASVKHLQLRPSVSTNITASTDAKSNAEVGSQPMHVDPSSPSSATHSVDSVIHFMLSELIRVGKSASESIAAVSSSDVAKPEGQSSGDASGQSAGPQAELTSTSDPAVSVAEDKSKDRSDFSYACMLMQYLTELLFSYDSCKLAFLSYNKKRTHTPAKDPKHKSVALHYLLNELISFGAFNVEPKFDGRKRIMLCNWAMSVVVALCVDCSSREHKDASADLTYIRKTVLEAVSRAIKDAPSAESIDARYGRLLALADLCHRLLTVRFNTGSSKAQDETAIHIAKLMLEKNYVATMTNVLSEVDLNYPNMRSLVSSILRPLEHLTKIAIKMGRASDKAKEKPEEIHSSTDDDMSDDDEDDDMDEDAPQEETLDLYRNSSLGMFDGGMEDANFNPEDELDQDDDLDEDDVDVEYDEETGSEDTSNTDQEDEADGDLDIGMEGDGSGAAWQDEDEDEDMEDVEDGTDDDDENQEEEAGLVDAEIMWQDVSGADGILQDGEIDGQDDDEDLEDMHIVHEEDPADEAGNMSEDDDIADGFGALEDSGRGGEDAFGFVRHNRGHGYRGESLFFTTGATRGRGRGEISTDMFIFGRPRQASGNAPEPTTHPLLVDATNSTGATQGLSRGLARRPQRAVVAASNYGGVLQSIEDIVGGGAMQFFQQLMGHGGAADIRVEVPAAQLMGLERDHLSRQARAAVRAVRLERDPRSGENRSENRDVTPLPTLQRWTEEAKMSHGKFLHERLSKLSNHIVIALLPEAREAKKEKERVEQEKSEKEAAASAEAAISSAIASEEASQDVEAPAEQVQSRSMDIQEEGAVTDVEMPAAVLTTEDTVMGEASQPDIENAQQPSELPVESIETVEIVDAVPPEDAVATESQPDPTLVPASTAVVESDTSAEATSSSAATERIMVTVHGSPVDITDTGIDPTFLEALPDDMREEVLNQHFRERRSSRPEPAADSQISTEFLDALPPEIRAEILQQERMERIRRERTQGDQNTAAEGTTQAAAVEMDPASFIASLEPQLREVVLLDSDDVFIQTLPSHMIAEAGVYRDGSHRAQQQHHHPEVVAQPAPTARKLTAQRDAIQLLDQASITILVRLLFFPQLVKKTSLHKVLVNLCENSKSRTDLFNLLLNILQDGTGDLSMVDRSFAQMSFRNTKSPLQITPRPTAKRKSTAELAHTPVVSSLPSDVSAELVAQRCLDALTYIVGANELSSLFFLTEHELPAGLKRATSKKGKGKEKQTPQSYYPIVLLLNLLDRQTLLKTPSIMDSVAGLLAAVTRPLTSLQEQQKKEDDSISRPSADDANDPSALPTATDTAATNVTAIAEGIASGVNASASETRPDATPSAETLEEKILLANPPQIPHSALRLIVNILTVGECSGRTFQHTLALIQHLFCIPDARDVIAQELKIRAEDFGQTLYSDLGNLITTLQAEPVEDELPSALAARFSPASSDQAKFLRVLKTIDYMYSSKAATAGQTSSTDQAAVQGIYESFRFPDLWQKLSDCLATVEQKSNVEHIATILLPLIESLMVVCKHVQSKSSSTASRLLRSPGSPRTPLANNEAMEDLFVSFTDAHRKVLNLMVRNNPSLMSGSFSLLINNPRVLDFDNKRNYFTQQLRRRPHPREHYGTLQLNVRRARVFEDSYQHLQRKTGEQIKYGKLSVRFYEEEGVDAGGVTREWFQILARQMFNLNYALFEPCAADKQTYQPSRASAVNNEHLSFFKFVGRVIGKAIYDGRLLDAHFARSLYRQLLGKPVDYRDVEWVDPEYYNSLCWILENDPTVLDLTFITEIDEFGKREIIPLKEGGTSLLVTNENKKEYVQLSAQYRLYSSIKEQIESLLGGFYEIVPKDLISIFNEQEVELLISGTPDIDVDEWRAATEYNGYTSSDPVIVWWWRALKSFNRDESAKVLSFATGTSRVPLGGFVELQGVQGVQRFSIHRAYGDRDRLPQAHTCFNQIDLPQYTSYEKLRQQLLMAINEGGEGFGFA